ncbi:MAG TPA: hypothetical protein VKE50_07280 [Thermoanaerobaculia bacterium]|nr:hypothetical protein [Thermoanaerobaculia bacterium]
MTDRKSGLRISLLFSAGTLMGFTALVDAAVIVPHLRGDLAELGIRPSLTRAVSHALSFGTFAMFAFALVVLASAIQSLRGRPVSQPVLAITAACYGGFGIAAFLSSQNAHSLGYVLIGALIGIAAPAAPTRTPGSDFR